jgi:hypothetical protein
VAGGLCPVSRNRIDTAGTPRVVTHHLERGVGSCQQKISRIRFDHVEAMEKSVHPANKCPSTYHWIHIPFCSERLHRFHAVVERTNRQWTRPGHDLMERAGAAENISVDQCLSAVLSRLHHRNCNVCGHPQTLRFAGEQWFPNLRDRPKDH